MAGSAEELAAVVREIRDRVRARYSSQSALGDLPLPDLMPLLHARDSAEGKVAAIGSVNPRPPGLLNSAVQRVKRMVARALDWHVREQIEFNRAAVECIQATLEAFNENNRALLAIAGLAADRIAAVERAVDDLDKLRAEVSVALQEFADMRAHWTEWRRGQETRIANNEITFLKNLAESHSAFQHRVTTVKATLRDLAKAQHSDFTRALANTTLDVQKRLWDDLDRVRVQFETLIHRELRLAGQRVASAPQTAENATPAVAQAPVPGMDWLRFADRFRGTEENIRERQRMYAEWLAGCNSVLDIGCGRGELLEVLREAGIPARGVDSNPEFVALCRSRGLRTEQSDLFDYLAAGSDSFDAIVATHVVEHLQPVLIPRLLSLIHARLLPGGRVALETPNPECLGTFTRHFYADPSHTHPVPPALLHFLLEEAGFGGIEIIRLNPMPAESPELAGLPPAFRDSFFGALDYAVIARKL
jgi:2-polyprenyl-3-methyl-5-hydroxy-6-metoxy-1,4-benzoquinol methylase